MGQKREFNQQPLSQYQLLNGTSVRPVPVKVHPLHGLQAAIELDVPVRVILCDGLIVSVRYKQQVDKLVNRARELRYFRTQCWRVQQWIKVLGRDRLETLLRERRRTFTRLEIEQLMRELQ